MANVTATPADMTITLGYFTSTKTGDITWTTPTIPDGATITSVKLTGTVTASNTNISSITLNGQSLTVSTSGASFTIDLETDNSKTSLTAEAKKSNSLSNYNVKFTNMKYIVEYEEQKYTVIFKDENGNVIKTVNNVSKGRDIDYIEPDMTKEGYAFIGWLSEDDLKGYVVSNVYKDLILVPKYAKNPTMTVIQNEGGYFTYNDVVYEGNQTFQVNYYSTFNLSITSKDDYGIAYCIMEANGSPFKQIIGASHSFNLGIDMTSDYIVTIKYEKLTAICNVTFKDYDGKVLKTEAVTFGTYPNSIKPDDPIRKGHKFTKWDVDISNPIVEDTVFIAQYTECLTVTIRQNKGGYFTYNNKKYEGDAIFTFDSNITMDIQIFANEGYYIAYTYTVMENFGLPEEEIRNSNVPYGTGWQNMQTSQELKIEYSRISSVNKENVIINDNVYKEAYVGDKPVRIYRGDDRIL